MDDASLTVSSQDEERLEFHGGSTAVLVPIFVLAAGLIWFSIGARGGAREFWAFAWLGLVAGLLLAKDKQRYCSSAVRGLTDKGGVTIVIAWLFAGVLGKVMIAGGLVEGISWLAFLAGVGPDSFVLVAFVSAMLFSVATGTSTGTALALAPVLYPSGVLLGSDPSVLALAILSGAVFGDNVAPISDTTIVSAFTQEATLRDVVRSRLPLAMAAAGISAIALFLAADGGPAAAMSTGADHDARGILMLAALAVVVGSSLAGRHLLESMVYGITTSVVVGALTGTLDVSQLVHVPQARGDSTGLIEDGLGATQNAIIFVLLVLALTQVVIDSGILERFLSLVQRRFISTVRRAELAIIAISVGASIPICSNAPAELLVGSSIVKPLGERFQLAPARRANLMDCGVCSVFYMLPWHIGVLVWHESIVDAAEAYSIAAPDIGIAFLNPYSWAILGVVLFSAWTGWNRAFEKAAPGTQ